MKTDEYEGMDICKEETKRFAYLVIVFADPEFQDFSPTSFMWKLEFVLLNY